MVIELFSYKSSILNPLLKIAVIVLFAIGTWYFYRAQRKFKGNIGDVARALMWGGIAGVIGAAFRLLGDVFIEFKWIESTGGLLFALVSVYVAYLVYVKFAEIAQAFGMKVVKKYGFLVQL
ncbi:MAG: hypothetical protein M0Q92_14185 [Methanoregula sp.]|jgi:uncharacterized membrane protein|nr:hypothetical protein [Methanoregula sp.]